MTNEWEVTTERQDLPPKVWSFIKDNGFFGLIIPKEYNGKGFSAYAHSQIAMKWLTIQNSAEMLPCKISQ